MPATHKAYSIAVIAGDGIGPEVIREGLRVLKRVSQKHMAIHQFPFGAKHFKQTGEVLSDRSLSALRKYDAIYLGAVGHPSVAPGILEKGLLLKLRFGLDLGVNVRPIVLYPGVETPLRWKKSRDIHFVVIRENTEGPYCGVGGIFKEGTKDEVAIQEDINTRRGVERVIRYAYGLARQRRRKKLALVDKANVLTFGHGLWRRVFREVGRSYKNVQTEELYVDATAMYFVTQPERFDVIVTGNMFGDILTDLGASIAGGIGLAASANIDPTRISPSLFEPVHGSAPDIVGRGRANPTAAILAGSLMLDFLGDTSGSQRIESAVQKTLVSGETRGLGTKAITAAVIRNLSM